MRRAYCSFGGGVQSTTLALLALERHQDLLDGLEREAEFWGWDAPSPLPEAYVFSDTGDEPVALYPHLERMASLFASAGIAFEIVRHPSGLTLLEHIEAKWEAWELDLPGKKGVSSPPFFTDTDGKRGLTRRQCTSHFKVRLIETWVKKYFEIKRSARGHRGGRSDDLIYGWLGISDDEKQRMKNATESWRLVSHPLVFMRWRRSDCISFLEERGIKPLRSACVYCPFRSAPEWAEVKAVPEDWGKVLELDQLLERAVGSGFAGVRAPQYLHPSLTRMRELSFDKPGAVRQLSLWNDECAGICGV
jgi:hypothetical protein